MKEGRNQKHKQLLSLPAACVGVEKQGVFLQESLVFSHLHTPEASCPFLQESSGVSAAEPSGFTVEAQQDSGIQHFVSV